MPIKFTNFQDFKAIFVVFNNDFFDAFYEKLSFLWIFADLQRFSKLIKTWQQIMNLFIVDLKVWTPNNKDIILLF